MIFIRSRAIGHRPCGVKADDGPYELTLFVSGASDVWHERSGTRGHCARGTSADATNSPSWTSAKTRNSLEAARCSPPRRCEGLAGARAHAGGRSLGYEERAALSGPGSQTGDRRWPSRGPKPRVVARFSRGDRSHILSDTDQALSDSDRILSDRDQQAPDDDQAAHDHGEDESAPTDTRAARHGRNLAA